MDNPSSTSLSISYNGKNLSEKITQYVESFQYTDNASGSADTVSITLNDAEHKWISDWFPRDGDYMETNIGVLNWDYNGDNRKLKCGKFLVDDFSFNGPPDTHVLSAISTPINTDFVSTNRSRTWKKATLKGIAQQIADNAGTSLVYDAKNHNINNCEQSDTSDMRFLFSLCSDYNLSMKLFNKKIVIFSAADYEKKKASHTITRNMCSKYSLNSTLVGIYNGVYATYTDSKTKKTLKYKYMYSNGKRILRIKISASSYSEAEIKAKARLYEENNKAITASITLRGDTKYVAATCVDLNGFGKFNGKYYIDRVRHALTNGYMVTLDLHKVN